MHQAQASWWPWAAAGDQPRTPQWSPPVCGPDIKDAAAAVLCSQPPSELPRRHLHRHYRHIIGGETPEVSQQRSWSQTAGPDNIHCRVERTTASLSAQLEDENIKEVDVQPENVDWLRCFVERKTETFHFYFLWDEWATVNIPNLTAWSFSFFIFYQIVALRNRIPSQVFEFEWTGLH